MKLLAILLVGLSVAAYTNAKTGTITNIDNRRAFIPFLDHTSL